MLFLVERIPQEAELAWQGNTAGHLKCAWMTAGVLETTTKQQRRIEDCIVKSRTSVYDF